MNSLFNLEHLGTIFERGTLAPAAEGPSATESRVDSVASAPIAALGNAALAITNGSLSLLEKKLSSDLIQKIATYFRPQDWGRFSRLTKEIHTLLNSKESTREICPILYRGFEKLYANPNVIRLDKDPEARRLLTLPEYKEPNPESIQSLKAHVDFLREAGLLAECSEDGKAVIVTIPKDWSIEKLETMSQAAVAAGIASARIEYWDPSYRPVLQSSPINKEEQRVAISNTVITGSRSKSIANQKALLKAKGLEEEFPDALMVLTIVVLSRILTNGAESSYARVSQDIGTYTRTNKKTPAGWTLCVGSAPSCVLVFSDIFGGDSIGAGGLREFPVLGT